MYMLVRASTTAHINRIVVQTETCKQNIFSVLRFVVVCALRAVFTLARCLCFKTESTVCRSTAHTMAHQQHQAVSLPKDLPMNIAGTNFRCNRIRLACSALHFFEMCRGLSYTKHNEFIRFLCNRLKCS